MAARVKLPVWFWLVAIMLVLWNAMGVWACLMQLREGPAAWGPVDDWARNYYAALPNWYNPLYVVSTFGGLLGGLALLLRERRAALLFWISLIGIVVMFGYVFAMTDLVAHKGAKDAVPFPIFIAVMGVFQIWFARFTAAKGWLGR